MLINVLLECFGDDAVECHDEYTFALDATTCGMEQTLNASNKSESLASPWPCFDPYSTRIRIDKRLDLRASHSLQPYGDFGEFGFSCVSGHDCC